MLVTRSTRLEALVARFHTRDQARFYVEHLGADFADYEAEHATYVAARRGVQDVLETHGRWQALDRRYLPNFLFAPGDVVVALGQDGLVANTMKYLDGQPLIGLNPDPQRHDGFLLPFEANELAAVLADVLTDKRPDKRITMAEARLPDGQSLLAVNDLFIGPPSHTSARYAIDWAGQHETQSSSGVIVSTGLGSTGWMASIVTGSLRIGAAWRAGDGTDTGYQPLPWDAGELVFAVREPFPSRTTGTRLVFGRCDARTPLTLTSQMADPGVIFSDGIEADRLDFGAGTAVSIRPAQRSGRLIV